MGILCAIAEGTTDAEQLSKLAKDSVVNKREELKKALKGSLKEHQKIMIRNQMEHVKALNIMITQLDEEIKKTEPNRELIERLDDIPGIGERTAERILAEIGVSMDQFPTAARLCSWAGLVPGNHERTIQENCITPWRKKGLCCNCS